MVPINEYVALKIEVDRLTDLVEDLTGKLNNVYQNAQSNVVLEKGIIVSSGGVSRFIRISEIVMMKADSNYSIIYLVDGTNIFTSKTLKYWSEKCNSPLLYRVHKSFIINTRMILKFEPAYNLIHLQGGQIVTYSKNGQKLFLQLK